MHHISTRHDQSTATRVLAQAYKQAPNITWAIDSSEGNLHYFFSSLVKNAMAKNGAFLTSNNRGVLLLYNMKVRNTSLRAILRKVKLILFIIGIRKSLQLMKLESLKKKLRPKTGLYGMALGILEDEQRWQTVLEIKHGFLEISKKHNLPVYVETTNQRIADLYLKIGFSTYHKMKHPYAELSIWFMKMRVED